MCRQCGSWAVAGRNHSKVIGRDPIVQVSKTWALTCPETVQRPCMMREMETWLSGSRVGNNSVVDHRNDHSSLHCVIVSTDVMPDHQMQAVEVDAQTSAYTGQFGRASMIRTILSVGVLRHTEGGATLLSTGSHESCVGCTH